MVITGHTDCQRPNLERTESEAWGVSPLPWTAVTTHCKITARLEGDRAMVLRLVEINKFLLGYGVCGKSKYIPFAPMYL